MGVPLLAKYFQWQYRAAYRSTLTGVNPYVLLMDLNSLIYEAVYKLEAVATPEEHVEITAKLVFERILQLIQPLQSTLKVLYIAFDGVAPKAKIVHQRFSRYASSEKKIFDTVQITPGTTFIIKFHQNLKKIIEARQKDIGIIIEYSSYLVPGEGEHKLMEAVRSRKYEGNILIYGLDTDLILLTLLSGVRNIYLWKDQFMNSKATILNVDKLYQFLQKDTSAVKDFLILLNIIGNDFVPEHPSIDSLNTIISLIKRLLREIKLPIVVHNKINKDHLKLFFLRLAAEEERLLLNKLTLYNELPDNMSLNPARFTMLENAFSNDKLNFEKFRHDWYTRAKVGEDSLEEMVQNYIEGYSFVLNYYQSGEKKINLQWCYHFYSAPLFADIIKYYPTTERKFNWARHPHAPRPTIPQQLVAVMPRSKHRLLPESLRGFNTEDEQGDINYTSEGFLTPFRRIVFTSFPDLQLIRKFIQQHASGIELHPDYNPTTSMVFKA